MRLQYKVILLVFGIILATGIIGGMIALRFQRQTAITRYRDSTVVLGTALRDSIERDMLLPDRQHIQQTVLALGSLNQVIGIAVLSARGEVYASSDVSTIGQTETSGEIAQALTTGETVTSPVSNFGRDNLFGVFLLLNKPDCHECHGAEPQILGAIKIGWDTSSLDSQIKEQTAIMVLAGGISLAIMVTALTLTLRSTVVGPLGKLAISARRIAGGDFTPRVEVKTRDEMGTVASAFNDMAQRIQERTEQLQEMVKIRGQLLERLISVQEEERRRIARELHDEASQMLSAIMMALSRVTEVLPEGATAARERLEQSRSLASQSLAELRRLIYDLRPEVLDQLGLVPALRSYVASRLEGQGIQVQLSAQGLKDRLPPQTEVTVFRVVQEAVNNIVRHSQATRVNIELVATDSAVTVTIDDNGKGFDVKKALQKSDSWGLRGIRERAAVVNGELTIESEVGKGTRLNLRVPR